MMKERQLRRATVLSNIERIKMARTRYPSKEAGYECHDPFPFLREISGIPYISYFIVHLSKMIRVDDENEMIDIS